MNKSSQLEQQAIEVRKTTDIADSSKALVIAQQLPEFFDQQGLKDIERDTKDHILYGAFIGQEMVGFATYKESSSDTIEMTWLAVAPHNQGKGIGGKLVTESLADFAHTYKTCEVKTLAESDPYEPYRKTRDFYKSLGFVTKEIIDQYPGWGNNPCQIFVKFLGA